MASFLSNDCQPSTSKHAMQNNGFLQGINAHFERVLQYENESLISLTKSHIPITSLQIKAIERLREIQKTIKLGTEKIIEPSLEDLFIIELMHWFKTKFFSWVDSPSCCYCSGQTKYSHVIHRSHMGNEHRVEIYSCSLCEHRTEFPRYNDVAQLLITRRGRCGEWANCFTLMCRAMNYDARLVIDNTDHVWTEIYSNNQKRWLHCDPCENVIDTPLMYETGWGKKLDYIIAYSREDVQDVTWRYSNKHSEVLQRRNKCNEDDLISVLMALREERWKNISKHRQMYIKKRICSELVEMMCKREANDDEKIGRNSGSLAWRLERKEILSSPFVWEITDEVCIRYQSSQDIYQLVSHDGSIIKTLKGWINGINEMKNMQRKEEHDWKMVYLARQENSVPGELSWRIKTKNGKSIKQLCVKVSSAIYQSGKVDWIINYNNKEIIIPKIEENNFILSNLDKLTEFTLYAKLSGGDGNEAWQHSQIFRQEISNFADFPFQILISYQ